VRVLVVNAGSSSLKLRLLDEEDRLVARRDLAAEGKVGEEELAAALEDLGPADAVGHRVVHGGRRTAGARLDEGLVAELTALADLAPLHQPPALAAMAVTSAVLPDVPAVACFDTAFHTTLPAAAATYAVPADWRNRWDLHRYGFHGLSHAWAARRAAELTGRSAAVLRVVTCHLGAGASLAAVAGGRSIDTTMGFTPLEGLVMATRSGSVDPGLLLWLQTHGGLAADEVADALEHRSGIRALAGTADLAEVVAGAEQGDADATLALDVYAHRARAGVAAMVAALGGVDVLVITGGAGEASPQVRAALVGGLGFLGLALDPQRNADAEPDAEIGVTGAVPVYVVAAREDLQIAGEVRAVLVSEALHDEDDAEDEEEAGGTEAHGPR
jgi:acetate kinase